MKYVTDHRDRRCDLDARDLLHFLVLGERNAAVDPGDVVLPYQAATPFYRGLRALRTNEDVIRRAQIARDGAARIGGARRCRSCK